MAKLSSAAKAGSVMGFYGTAEAVPLRASWLGLGDDEEVGEGENAEEPVFGGGLSFEDIEGVAHGESVRLRCRWMRAWEEDRLVVTPAASLRPSAEWNPPIRMKLRMDGPPESGARRRSRSAA